MENQYDRQATHDKVRAKYGAVERFCREHGLNKQTYYRALNSTRGHSQWPAPMVTRVIDILQAEGLLVVMGEDAHGRIVEPAAARAN